MYNTYVGNIGRNRHFIAYWRPSRICGFLKEVVLLDTWISGVGGGRFVQNASFQEAVHRVDLQACCFMVTKAQVQPFVIGRNSQKDGVDVRILKIISGYMNFSQHQCTSDNYENPESRILFRNSLASDTAETNAYLYTIRYTFIVHRSEPKPRWSSISHVFTPTVWICILLSLIVATFAIRNIGHPHFVKDSQSYKNLVPAAMSAWGAILGTGVSLPRSLPVRIFFCSWLAYSLAVNNVFQTYMVSYLIDPGFEHQVDSLRELVQLRYKLAFDAFQPFLQVTYSHGLHNLTYYFSFPKNSVLFALFTEGSALFTSEELFAFNMKNVRLADDSTILHLFSDDVMQVHVGLSVHTATYETSNVGYAPIQKRFAILMKRLVEAGVPDKIMRDVTDVKDIRKWTYKVADLEEEFVPISLSHLQSPLALMFLGYATGLLCLLGEVIFQCILK